MFFKHEPTGYYVKTDRLSKARIILQNFLKISIRSIDFKEVEVISFDSINKIPEERKS